MNAVTREIEHLRPLTFAAAVALAVGCNSAPQTSVVLDNASDTVVYQGWWQAASFAGPIAPGGSSDPQPAVATSGDTAYVVLAPGWDPNGTTAPTSFIVLRSRAGHAVHLGDTLHIRVDDTSFEGDCAAGSPLEQRDADFITQMVFPSVFAGLRYDAATCATTPLGDAAP